MQYQAAMEFHAACSQPNNTGKSNRIRNKNNKSFTAVPKTSRRGERRTLCISWVVDSQLTTLLLWSTILTHQSSSQSTETWFHKGLQLNATRFHQDTRSDVRRGASVSARPFRVHRSLDGRVWTAAISRQELMRLFRRLERCILRLYIATAQQASSHQRINVAIIAHAAS